MDLLKSFFSFLRKMAVVIQTILSLMNLLLWATIAYVVYQIWQDPLSIYQIPVSVVKAVSGHHL